MSRLSAHLHTAPPSICQRVQLGLWPGRLNLLVGQGVITSFRSHDGALIQGAGAIKLKSHRSMAPKSLAVVIGLCMQKTKNSSQINLLGFGVSGLYRPLYAITYGQS